MYHTKDHQSQELHDKQIYSVSQLNAETKLILEEHFQFIWVTGEISNLIRASSGHFYFSLKDSHAQIRCAYFRQRMSKLNFTPENGQHVLIQARVSLYETRGEFQLIVADMQLAGDGALQLAFEKLKRRLDAEGLFNQIHKKALPRFPHTIGVITSPTGAAIRDILTVLERRCHTARIIIYPTLVQGAQAAGQIVSAIQTAQQRAECEVLIVARGGGSIEDLWPFNEEIVARAIFNCDIPLISGIGHEIDFTIADFVADQRAPTPSAAAEMVSPSLADCAAQLEHLYQRLLKRVQQQFDQARLLISSLEKRVRHPSQLLSEQAQRLAQIHHRLVLMIQQQVEQKQASLQRQLAKILHFNPRYELQRISEMTEARKQRLLTLQQQQLMRYQNQLANVSQQLDSLSPLKTLERGYAIATTASGAIIHQSKQVKKNDSVNIRLAAGSLKCLVEEVK